MPSRTAWSRVTGGLILLFTLLATMAAAPAATAQAGDATVEVHNRVCPTGYAGQDYFQDCHDNPPEPGLPFTLTDGVTREDTTNENGNVGFANLPADTYTITGGAPGEFTDYVVYCAVGTEAESNQEQVPIEYVTGGIQLELPADTNVICDWYTIPLSQNGQDPTPTTEPQPSESSIEVHNRVCPTGYEGENYFEDCHANEPEPGLPFTFADGVTREGETNENGNVGFANLPAGTYTITGGAPGEFTDYVVYCSTESTNEQVPVEYVTGGIQLDLAANTNVLCDWYTIPQSQDGGPTPTQEPAPTETPVAGDATVEIHNRICPEDYQGQDYFQDCHGNVPDPGLPFTLTDSVTREDTTNENGNVGFANLPADTYTITGGAPGEFTDYVVYCAVGTEAESNQEQVPIEYVTGGIQLELPADTNVICDWYTIPLSQDGNPTATATAEPEMFDLPIYKLLCDDDPDQSALQDFVTVGTVPAGCEQFAGTEVTVTDGDGNTIGSCVTNAQDPCYVTVTVGTTVFATEDLATVPEGYAPLQSETQEVPIEPATEASALFVNVQVDPTPTAEPADPTPTTEPLPPGRPLQIHEGSCDPGALGETVVELEDLRSPVDGEDDDVVGQSEAVVAETSTSTVSLTLDELLANDHAIVAFEDGDTTDQSPPAVACTVIGGVLNSDGELVIGVKELDDSELTGIAYLAPADDDASQTDISVFLAEGLAEDDTEGTPEP